MTEMQTYYPVPEPVTAWQWDGKPETTEKMLKRWGDKIAYFPATPIKSLMSKDVTVMPHYLRIKRLPNNTLTRVDEGEYIIENKWGIYVSSRHRFEKSYQVPGRYIGSFPLVSRIEVIKDSQRDYVKYGFDGADIAIQDEGRTIKVFANSKKQLPDDLVKTAKAMMPEVEALAQKLCEKAEQIKKDREGCEHCGMDKEFHEKNDGCW